MHTFTLTYATTHIHNETDTYTLRHTRALTRTHSHKYNRTGPTYSLKKISLFEYQCEDIPLSK